MLGTSYENALSYMAYCSICCLWRLYSGATKYKKYCAFDRYGFIPDSYYNTNAFPFCYAHCHIYACFQARAYAYIHTCTYFYSYSDSHSYECSH